jgi:hypothetical protein
MNAASMVGDLQTMNSSLKLDDFYKEEFIDALTRIQKQYPCTFIHFFMAELDPAWYKQYMDNLGKDNDSRQSDSGLGQEQEKNSG